MSLYNEGADRGILPTPTIFAVGIVNDIRKTCTAELKAVNNRLYLIGDTKKEFGGSEYYQILGAKGGTVPRVDFGMLSKTCESVVTLIEKGAIAACHDVSDGGLAVAVSEMIIGSDDLGASIDISKITDIRSDFKLFSESNTRFIAEVSDVSLFESVLRGNKVPFHEIGRVTKEKKLIVNDNGRKLVQLDIDAIRKKWDNGIRSLVG